VGVVPAGGASGSGTAAGRGTAPTRRARGVGRGHLRSHLGMHLEPTAFGLRAVRSDRLSPVHRVDRGPGVGQAPPPGPGRTRFSRVTWSGRGARSAPSASAPSKGGDLTGPDPADRGKNGPKIHLIADRRGLPVPIGILAANLHGSQALIPLVRGIPPLRSRRGRRRRRPGKLHADKVCDYQHLRRRLCSRAIRHRTARKGTESSQRLGRHPHMPPQTHQLKWLPGQDAAAGTDSPRYSWDFGPHMITEAVPALRLPPARTGTSAPRPDRHDVPDGSRSCNGPCCGPPVPAHPAVTARARYAQGSSRTAHESPFFAIA
jgi:hypothetical protein